MMGDYSQFLAFAHQLADSAREVTLSYFRQALSVEHKADNSPVTIADQQTEALLRKKINATYPTHGIIGEEQVQQQGSCAYEWIIDPIDGTKNFLSGYPLYGTLICLLENGHPIVSVIDIPAQNERFFATASTPTLYRKGDEADHVIHSNEKHSVSASVLYSTDYSMFTEAEHTQLKALREAVSLVRYNGDCYLYAMLAAGWIDIVLEADLKVYDFLPLILIIEQAGGVITDWHGQPLDKHSHGQVLACANSTLHQAALALIQR